MNKDPYEELIDKLLLEMEEEDIAISLFTTFYQDTSELAFFQPADRERVLRILKVLSEDSKRHKVLLTQIISQLEEKKNNEK